MVRISLKIANRAVQPLEDALCSLTRSPWGIEREPGGEPLLFGYFEDGECAESAFRELCALFPDLKGGYAAEEIDDRDWRNEYKKYLKPWSFGKLHWIPVWMRGVFPVPEGHTALYFDAGMAFGTGGHPTTQLCARAMLEYAGNRDVSQKDFIDAGCGSGILTLSALLLGFGGAYGFDRDPEAVEVSRENALKNGISPERAQFLNAGIERGLEGRKADVLAANIISDVLRIYCAELVRAVKDGGWLILSGILSAEADKVEKFFAESFPERILVTETKRLGEWAGIVLKMK